EHEITSAHKNIDRIWVTKQDGSEAQTVSEVINAIQSADMVVMGPGSLYTSILPNLMIPQIGKAVARTKAKVVYISNIMTQFGETSSFSDADHVMAIHRNVGEPIIDYVLTNTAQVDENRVDFDVYDEISHQVAVDKKAVDALGVIQVADDFLSMHDGGAFHNGEKIVDKLLDILNEK
ncbi:MAG: 2-phospho-L-lactate transferase CofD family protein, partial [Lactobacillaceae bacterium]|nr:2-phospho-L-lactate transferase CofD family protein [Lactobacillaceae bacterium]